jgi:GntR family transcriptional regulator, transcriptional repressor for pyruvate dehydrogenase complex
VTSHYIHKLVGNRYYLRPIILSSLFLAFLLFRSRGCEVKEQETVHESPMFKPLPARRAFEEIADQIKDLVYSGKLKPGDRLPSERELAVQFRTGRMAVREALRILEQSGLVQIRQGSEGGAFVREVDPGVASQSVSDAIRRSNMSLHGITAVRIALEELVAELAIQNITPEELNQLESALEEAEGLLDAHSKQRDGELDSELLAEINVDFHLLLARATKNLLLEIIFESLQNALHIYFRAKTKPLEFFAWHVSQHRIIFDAIKSKKVREAKRLLKAHATALQERFSELDDSISTDM